ncbi:hypothetical protein Tamer19_04100 [Cupriavidus sp. TA19]|uniref:Zn-ribbon domain-containing OB-fold protein n=1 Tax=unclassified Cupriavidus TaxID=2640874 RepID=UPI000E2F5E7B|nr:MULTISPECIES: zinc ribbon domain-containing protein [unclassified Cupriavidus]BDB26294.1 OB-fold domain-containing protein [Cupriavidus sp. P-10]GLC91002.1 hypothetical protein Tamer19_04100 [Cupriavidus sp. TA19]
MSHDSQFPACRSAAWQGMAEATPDGGLALPQCPACAHLFYPPQRYCPRCLHDRISFRADSGAGVVLSVALLHSTLVPAFVGRLPVHVAAVRLDAGVTLFALADAMLPAGTRVAAWLDQHEDNAAGVLRVRRLLTDHENHDGGCA